MSPFGAAVIRWRQSSVTNDTQYPVRSTGAAARGGGGGPGGGPMPGNCAAAITTVAKLKIKHRNQNALFLFACSRARAITTEHVTSFYPETHAVHNGLT